MSLWGQIAYLACAEMPDIWPKKDLYSKIPQKNLSRGAAMMFKKKKTLIHNENSTW